MNPINWIHDLLFGPLPQTPTPEEYERAERTVNALSKAEDALRMPTRDRWSEDIRRAWWPPDGP